MNCLVIGYGSIGARHSAVLSRLGHKVSIVSSRDIPDYPRYLNLRDALHKRHPDFIVIANNTRQHIESLTVLSELGYKNKLLIEKPIFDKFYDCGILVNDMKAVCVGYNMRFHPIIKRLKKDLLQATILSCHIYAGSHLPDWRPNRPYQSSYSAKKTEGGGVLRDLSHELDYACWIFGAWEEVSSRGGHISPLEIDSDDICQMLVRFQRCAHTSIELNYFDRNNRREIHVVTDQGTFYADLNRGIYRKNNQTEESVSVNYDQTYRDQAIDILENGGLQTSHWQEALHVLELIEATERSQLENHPVSTKTMSQRGMN